MVWMLNFVYGTFVAFIIFARFEGRPAWTSEHNHAHDVLSENVTVLSRGDTRTPQRHGPVLMTEWEYCVLKGNRYLKAWKRQHRNSITWPTFSVTDNFEFLDFQVERHGELAQIEPDRLRIPGRYNIASFYSLYKLSSLYYLLIRPATFVCALSAQTGVFAALNINPGDMPPEWDFSQVAWYLWWFEVTRDAVPTHDYDFSRLRYFFVDTLTAKEERFWNTYDKQTFDVINDIYCDARAARIDTFRPGTENFLALLGTPYAASIMLMLTERKADFKGHGITSIVVQMEYGKSMIDGQEIDSPKYTMLVVIGPPD